MPPREFRVGPDPDPDYYLIDATPVATGTEGILYRGSLTVGNVELDVAVKMLQPCFLDRVDDWLPRWCEQVELLRSLHFPGVVGVRDGFLGPLPHPPGEAGGERTLYLVMNWVEGRPLDEWVQQGPDRDPVGTLKLLLGVAAALDFMHSGRATGRTAVVHGDVKPSNILVNDEGTVLVDFGLCRGLPGGRCFSGVSGTRGYIAPEILQDGLYTPAGDRYAFGAVAYFVLTGKETPATHGPEELRHTLSAVPELADREDAVDHVMAMLDADPAARPTSLTNWLGQVRRSTLPPLLTGGSVAPASPLHDPASTASELGEVASRLARALYAVDTDGATEFVRQQANGSGPSADVARQVVSSLDRIWVHYSVAADVVQRVDAALAHGRSVEAQRLLQIDAVEIPDGTSTSVVALLGDLERQLNDVVSSTARLVATARQAVTDVDDASKALDHLGARAAAIGVEDDTALARARTVLDSARVAVANDPLTADPERDLAGAVDAAGRRIEELERQWESLPGRLAAARRDLAEVSRLVAEGAAAMVEARSKITGVAGLLEPLSPSVVDGDERALAPWLERIERQARTGNWRAAWVGLERWQRVASAHQANARRVLEANRTSLERRNELRGLLDAFRAKAASEGRAEDPVLIPLHRAACDSLYVAPCDLDTAAERVAAFIDAVNTAPPEDEA
ncbi:MAG: protein kinase [Actinomycetota bacterium]|nr:protein kinase [Actinomycetota bacterium]